VPWSRGYYLNISTGFGGDGGIRTLGTGFTSTTV
jgi:hypothetical protein